MSAVGGRYDFDDGGSYCGGWEDGKAHGHGVCTGPKGQGEYSGAWALGFEASGVYLWPSGNTFGGQWLQGQRHGLGVEKKDKWAYLGEWAHGFKGRYGVRQSTTSSAKYEGTWANGLQDGYGCETYADGGTYQGQWQKGTRHGYGVRQSVSYGLAAEYKATLALRTSQQSLHSDGEDDKLVRMRDKKVNETRGGFILTSKSESHSASSQQRSTSGSRLLLLLEKPGRTLKRSLLAAGLKLRKQRSANDVTDETASLRGGKFSASLRSTRSFVSQKSGASSAASATASKASLDDDRSFYSQDDITDSSVTETYLGEWNGDKRCGFGVSERSDGLKYEGEWYNNRKHGYGTTTRKDGTFENGKYKNNIIVSSDADAKSRLLIVQRGKLTERVGTSVQAARRAAELALQKADVATSRMANARAKAELAMAVAERARQDSDQARLKAAELDPKFHQPGTAILKKRAQELSGMPAMKETPDPRYNPRLTAVTTAGQLQASPSQPTPGGSDSRSSATASKHPLSAGSADANGMRNPFPNGKLPSPVTLEDAFEQGGHDQQQKAGGRLSTMLSQSLADHYEHYQTAKRNPSGTGSGGEGPAEHVSRTKPFSATLDSSVTTASAASNNGSDVLAASATFISGQKAGQALIRMQSAKVTSRDKPRLAVATKHPTENGMSKLAKLHLSKDDTTLLSPSLMGASATVGKKQPEAESERATNLLSSRQERGSLPDVTVIRDMSALTREEVQKLSAERREEIRMLLNENERRRNGDLSILASDVKKWVQQRKLIMLVVAINVGLASIIFKWMY